MTLLAHSSYPFDHRYAQGQVVSAHGVSSFMCVVTNRRFAGTIRVDINLADVLSVSILKRENQCSFWGSRPVSTAFSSRTVYTEQNNNHLEPAPGQSDKREVICQSRVFRRCLPIGDRPEEIEIEADARHVDILTHQLNLKGAKSVASLVVNSTTSDVGPPLLLD